LCDYRESVCSGCFDNYYVLVESEYTKAFLVYHKVFIFDSDVTLRKSFLVLKILILQFSKYCTLLRFSVYVSPSVFIAQINVLLSKPNSLASLLAMSIANKDASVYMPALKSLIDLVIYVSASVLNSVLSCLISDRFFLFKCIQR
jgi:hypothetical protein